MPTIVNSADPVPALRQLLKEQNGIPAAGGDQDIGLLVKAAVNLQNQKASSASGVASITGTAGQVAASASTGAVTLSLPTALTSINSVTAAAATDLTLAGGTAGTSAVKVTNTTLSNSTLTGALVVAGGVGVQGAINSGGPIKTEYAQPTVSLWDTTAYNAAPLPSISFTGKYNVAGGYDALGSIRAYKVNATDGDAKGGLRFYTNASPATPVLALTLDNTGSATVAGAISTTSTGTFGNARASSWSLDTSLAFFGHQSAAGASGTYGMLQTSAGNTQINGASTLTLNINNAAQVSVASGGVTFSAQAILPLGTTARSSLRIPHGAAPTTPVDGDIWTTTAGLFVRINGVTVGPLT